MQRVIVSGFTGHLGRELVRLLASTGVEIVGLTRTDTSMSDAYTRVHSGKIDGRTETLVALFERIRPDCVFHLAGLYRREHCSGDVVPLIETNVLFGTQLLEAMKLSGCQRLITAGTYFQHFTGNASHALNLYAATKQAFEDLLAFYVDAFDMSAVRLTLPDIYSEYDTRPKLITAIAAAYRERTVLRLQDEEAWIDPVHVSDVAAAFLRAAILLEGGEIPPGTLSRYSVSYGRDVTASELIRLFERQRAGTMPVSRGTGWHFSRRMRPWRGECVPTWNPHVTIEDGVARIISAGSASSERGQTRNAQQATEPTSRADEGTP